ncbi:hypothetical protein QUF72_05245 [Desulfobacterales bacterium HSG2]|nr:hypothetical protein [Desulfobacterales bacterium HSG2]
MKNNWVMYIRIDEARASHRPHPSPNTDRGAVASIRRWPEINGVTMGDENVADVPKS